MNTFLQGLVISTKTFERHRAAKVWQKQKNWDACSFVGEILFLLFVCKQVDDSVHASEYFEKCIFARGINTRRKRASRPK